MQQSFVLLQLNLFERLKLGSLFYTPNIKVWPQLVLVQKQLESGLICFVKGECVES